MCFGLALLGIVVMPRPLGLAVCSGFGSPGSGGALGRSLGEMNKFFCFPYFRTWTLGSGRGAGHEARRLDVRFTHTSCAERLNGLLGSLGLSPLWGPASRRICGHQDP